jgi:predicted nuclease with TOPRIM domain
MIKMMWVTTNLIQEDNKMAVWSRKSFGDKLNDVNVMVTGLRDEMSRVSQRGLSEEFVTEMESLLAEARKLDAEQENLKAALKQKTAELEAMIDKLGTMMDEAKKVVKLEFEQEAWKKFGFSDKR